MDYLGTLAIGTSNEDNRMAFHRHNMTNNTEGGEGQGGSWV
jgi:hypothetical protein